VALLLGAAALLAFLHLLGEGPFVSMESAHLRDMKNRVDPPPRFEPFTFDSMAALPHRLTVAEYSGLERRGVTMEGYVQRLMRASDGDLHLEIVTYPLGPGAWDTIYVTAEITPRVRRDRPHWTYEGLLEVFRPLIGGATPWSNGTRR